MRLKTARVWVLLDSQKNVKAASTSRDELRAIKRSDPSSASLKLAWLDVQSVPESLVYSS